MPPSIRPTNTDQSWPYGPYKELFEEQKKKMDAWHFGFDAYSLGVLEAENKVGFGISFYGDIAQDIYQFVFGYRYYPDFFGSTLSHQIMAGLGIKKEWGDYRVLLMGELPSDISMIKDNFRIGALVQVYYPFYDVNNFRAGVMGEAGISAGRPEIWKSHLGGGLFLGFPF